MDREHKIYLRKIKIRRLLIILCQIILLILVFGLWEYCSNKGIINSFIYSSPSRAFNSIVKIYNEGELFHHIWVTVYETVISFGFATLLGVVIAIVLWYFDFIYKVIEPYLTIINSLPKVALGPIIIIVFGAKIDSIIIMALLISLIITIVNVYNGFVNTDINKIKLMNSFNASKIQILKYLVIPYNYHVIVNSLKINVSMSLIGLLPPVGENLYFNKYYSKC